MALTRALHRKHLLALKTSAGPQATASTPPTPAPINSASNTLIATSASDDAKTDGTLAQPLLPDSAVLSFADEDVYKVPKEAKGWVWDTWYIDVVEVPKNPEELKKFLINLERSSVALTARINRYDEGTTTMVDTITLITAGLSLMLTYFSASDSLEQSTYKNVQTTVSTVSAGFALFSNFISRQVTNRRNLALEHKGDIDELIEALKPQR
jgi:hypothetical protein